MFCIFNIIILIFPLILCNIIYVLFLLTLSQVVSWKTHKIVETQLILQSLHYKIESLLLMCSRGVQYII